MFGYRLDGFPWLTETPIDGVLLLPQATNNPASTSARHRLPTMEYLDRLRPAKPARTIPASGKVNGNHGSRLSARRRCCFVGLPEFWFGPAVVMLTVTLLPALAGLPAAIDAGLKVQLLFVRVGSLGLKLHWKVTVAPKMVWPFSGTTAKL